MRHDRPTNIVIAGLGGQGVLTAADLVAQAAFAAALDVKKAEVHGMSQRGGSVATDVRFGQRVLSPMVPAGEADYLVALSADQVDVHRRRLREGGVVIVPTDVNEKALPHARSINVALIGVLSTHLDLASDSWRAGIHASLPQRLWEMNEKAFELGRAAGKAGAIR